MSQKSEAFPKENVDPGQKNEQLPSREEAMATMEKAIQEKNIPRDPIKVSGGWIIAKCHIRITSSNRHIVEKVEPRFFPDGSPSLFTKEEDHNYTRRYFKGMELYSMETDEAGANFGIAFETVLKDLKALRLKHELDIRHAQPTTGYEKKVENMIDEMTGPYLDMNETELRDLLARATALRDDATKERTRRKYAAEDQEKEELLLELAQRGGLEKTPTIHEATTEVKKMVATMKETLEAERYQTGFQSEVSLGGWKGSEQEKIQWLLRNENSYTNEGLIGHLRFLVACRELLAEIDDHLQYEEAEKQKKEAARVSDSNNIWAALQRINASGQDTSKKKKVVSKKKRK